MNELQKQPRMHELYLYLQMNTDEFIIILFIIRAFVATFISCFFVNLSFVTKSTT